MPSHETTTDTLLAPRLRPPVLLVLIAAFAFGLLAAWVKGPNTDGLSALSRLRGDLADLSAPWLIVAFLARAAGPGGRDGALSSNSWQRCPLCWAFICWYR